MISGNMVGMYSTIGKTFVLVDENGTELTGVVVDQMTIFDATDNDVREGSVYASDGGVSVGTKVIPVYQSRYGCKYVLSGKEATISVPEYNYDSVMIIISTYDTNIEKSVVSTYISIDNGMYAVGSGAKISDIVIDKDNERINLGIYVSEKSVLRYFVMREEY